MQNSYKLISGGEATKSTLAFNEASKRYKTFFSLISLKSRQFIVYKVKYLMKTIENFNIRKSELAVYLGKNLKLLTSNKVFNLINLYLNNKRNISVEQKRQIDELF